MADGVEGTYDIQFTGRLVVRRVAVPVQSEVQAVQSQGGMAPMAARVCTIQLSPVDPAAQVTSRPCKVVFADGTPTVNVDMINPAATFTGTDGQQVTVTALGDVNVVGQGSPSDPFPYKVGPPPPTVVPVKPTVLGVKSV